MSCSCECEDAPVEMMLECPRAIPAGTPRMIFPSFFCISSVFLHQDTQQLPLDARADLVGHVGVQAADVYSYGVVLWEIVLHTRAWAGMLHAQIMYAVAMKKLKLEFPAETHDGYSALALDCMAYNPNDRPTFPEVVQRLTKLIEAHNPEAEE